MPVTRRLFRLAVLLLAAVIFASCGGDDNGNKNGGAARAEACPEEIPMRATFLPSGFQSELKEGAGREGPPKDVVAFHYEGSGDKVIDVFRGGRRAKFEKGEAVRGVLGDTARIKAIPGGVAARLVLGRGTCSKYQYEGYGVSEEDMKKLVLGLERVATDQPEADE